VSFEDGKRVALQYPSLVDPDWQTGLLERLVTTFHGQTSARPPA
jgi:hypothetical protein